MEAKIRDPKDAGVIHFVKSRSPPLPWWLHSSCSCLVTQVCVQLFAIPWTAACQSPLLMGILQARLLGWVACPPPGDLPNPGIEPRSPTL